MDVHPCGEPAGELSIQDAVIALDAAHHVIFFGPGAQRLFRRKAAEVIGRPIEALFAPAQAEAVTAVLKALREGPAPARTLPGSDPVLALVVDGRQIWLEGTLLKLIEGDPCSPVLAVLRELPDPEARDQHLSCLVRPDDLPRPLPLDECLAALMRYATMAIWLKDRAGRYLAASPAFAELVGLREHELVGRTDAALLAEPEARLLREHDLAALRAGGPTRHEEVLALGPRRRVLETLRIPLFGSQGLPVALCGVTVDTTEQRQAQLRNAQLAAIFLGSDDAMGSETLEGVVTTWNPAGERIYGYSEAELVGRSIFEVVPPEDQDHLHAVLKRVAAGETVVRDRVRRIHKDGHVFWVAVTLAPLRDASGQVVGISVISRDVGRLEEAEGLARKLQADLAAAREEERAKQAFFSAISHELRSPLTAVVGWAELLQDEVGGPLTADQRKYVAMLLAAARDQQTLLGDILDLARADAGTFEVRPGPADLAAAVRASLEQLAPQAAKAGVALRLDLPPEGLEVPFDRDRIAQVLRNLVGNALKFTPAGGQVTVRVRPDGAWARCEVTDAGPGIAPEDQARLFRPFSQLPGGRARGGAGLGLAICKAIVEAHGGRLAVTSTPGRGSAFTFDLPRGGLAP